MKGRLIMLVLWLACVLVSLIALVWMLCALVVGHQRAEHIAFGFDQTGNTAFGGHWDEKISSRAWRERNNSKRWYYLRMLIDVLFFFDPNHCETSFKQEQQEALHILQKAGA